MNPSTLPRMGLNEPDDVGSPDTCALHAKTVTSLSAEPVRRVDLRLHWLTPRLHVLAEDAVRRQIIVVLGLKEENRDHRIAGSTDQSGPQIRGVVPGLGGARAIHGSAIPRTSLDGQQGLDPAK